MSALPVGRYTLSFYTIIDKDAENNVDETLLVRMQVVNWRYLNIDVYKQFIVKLNQKGERYFEFTFDVD